MNLHQLEFDLGEPFGYMAPAPRKNKRNPNRVFPHDITIFMAKFLPDYVDGILSGRLSEGPFRFPRLEAVHDVEPRLLVPFNAVMSLSGEKLASFPFFHFFVHDYQFERMWSHPDVYLPFLLELQQGIGPDFSMYLYMHPAELIINCCRNRFLAFYLQKMGATTIPNACFGDESTLSWAFDGLPEHSVLAVNSQGCMRDGMAKRSLLNGLHALVRQKHPKLLYVYGHFPEEWKDKFGVEIRTLPAFVSKWGRAC